MAFSSKKNRQLFGFFTFLGLLVAGTVLVVYPTQAAEATSSFTTNLFTDGFTQVGGYAQTGNVIDTKVTASAPVTLQLKLLESGITLYSATSSAGTFDIVALRVPTPGNILIDVDTVGGIFTNMNVQFSVSRLVTGFAYWPIGAAVIAVAALLVAVPKAPLHRIISPGLVRY